ncbi:MAG: VanZ family protein [Gammaproteobacteria bacterium]
MNVYSETIGKNYLLPLFIYGVFIVYGSLVPFELNQLSLEDARIRFSDIRWLRLGAYSRADWIANILLYIPFSVLLCASIDKDRDTGFYRTVKFTFVIFFCLVLAVTTEFFQQFYPPRTVSLNDLLAEILGSLIGVFVWRIKGPFFVSAWHWLQYPSRFDVSIFLSLYVVLYLLHALFPFDFVVSSAELQKSLSWKKIQWIGASDVKGGLFSLFWSFIQFGLSIPVGFFISGWFNKNYLSRRGGWFFSFICGFLIEFLQIFLISGYFTFVSVITRFTGFIVGFKVCDYKINWTGYFKYLRRYIWVLVVPYLIALAYFNGWHLNVLGTEVNDVYNKIAKVKWLPFYYHYYVPETVALTSLLYTSLMYVPIGVGLAISGLSLLRDRWGAAGLAFLVSAVIESGKLFFVKHPDPTNVLIASAAAFLGFHFVSCFIGELPKHNRVMYVDPGRNEIDRRQHAERSVPSETSGSQPRIEVSLQKGGWFQIGIALSILGFCGWHILNFPVFPFLLFIGLVFYSALLWKYPSAWLIVLPALAPNLDFADLSGRFYFSEFDHFVLITIAIGLFCGRWHVFGIKQGQFHRVFYLILFFLVISFSISLYSGVRHLSILDENAFSNYYSPLNALRVVKGFVGAFILLPMLGTEPNIDRMKRYFAFGMVLGLAILVAVSVFERITFSGLFNYETNYRITGSFSSMHTGGGHIDAYLMLALPFVLAMMTVERLRLVGLSVGFVIVIGAVYVVMVTFSRGPYIGLLLELIVLSMGLCFRWYLSRSHGKGSFFLLATILLAISAVTVPVLQGSYIQERFERVAEDFHIRKQHWRDAIEMMDPTIATTMFGMGLGSYPRTYYWRNSEHTLPATYQFRKGLGGQYLELSSGDSLYFEQKVNVLPNKNYRLIVEARTNSEKAGLTIPLCEKSLLYSYTCAWNTFRLVNLEDDKWQRIEKSIDTARFATKSSFLGQLFRRPIKLSLYNGNGKEDVVIDIRSVQLLDSLGEDLVKNGDFRQGIDNWFFSTDNHLPWHIKNIWVQVLFDQGWFGLFIFLSFIMFCFSSYSKGLFEKSIFSLIGLISLIGFLVVGVVDSPFDEPRLTFLFFLTSYILVSGSSRAKRLTAI